MTVTAVTVRAAITGTSNAELAVMLDAAARLGLPATTPADPGWPPLLAFAFARDF